MFIVITLSMQAFCQRARTYKARLVQKNKTDLNQTIKSIETNLNEIKLVAYNIPACSEIEEISNSAVAVCYSLWLVFDITGNVHSAWRPRSNQ